MRDLDVRSIHLRRKIIDVMAVSRQGHIRSAFSCLEIVRVLYDSILKPGDKFILSKGHGCLAQYVLLAEKGYFPESELYKFCQTGALLGGHPTAKIPGVEVATGALGHGLPIGVGFALAGHRTFVLMGDGECNEGSVWEAAMCAAKHKLNNLAVIVDYNQQQSYGTTREVCELEPFVEKWQSFGWGAGNMGKTIYCGEAGHDVNFIKNVLKVPFFEEKPVVFIFPTIKGKGIKLTEKDLRWHHKSDITDEQIKSLYEGLEEYV